MRHLSTGMGVFLWIKPPPAPLGPAPRRFLFWSISGVIALCSCFRSFTSFFFRSLIRDGINSGLGQVPVWRDSEQRYANASVPIPHRMNFDFMFSTKSGQQWSNPKTRSIGQARSDTMVAHSSSSFTAAHVFSVVSLSAFATRRRE